MEKPIIYFVTGNAGKLKEVTSSLQPTTTEAAPGEKPFPYRLEAVKIDLDELQSDVAEQISQVKALEAFRVVNNISADAATRSSVGEGNCESFQLTFSVPCTGEGGAPAPFKDVLVDDTSLSFAALGDMPGPYIKFFLKALGPGNLVNMVKGFAPHASAESDANDSAAARLGVRRATATSIFTLARAHVLQVVGATCTYVVKTEQFIGNSPGCLVLAPRGDSGFGWDSAFAPLVNTANYGDNKAALEAYGKDPATGRFPEPSAALGFQVDDRAFTRTYAELSHDEKNLVSHRAVALRKMKRALASE